MFWFNLKYVRQVDMLIRNTANYLALIWNVQKTRILSNQGVESKERA